MPEFHRSRSAEASKALYKSGKETGRQSVTNIEDWGAVKENALKALLVYTNIFAIVLLAVLLPASTGVLRRTMQTTHGASFSTMGTRTTTTTRTTSGWCGLSGVLNKQVYRPDEILSGRYT